MCRAISLAPEDRDYSIIGSCGEVPLLIQMTRVTFRIASSALLATNSVQRLAEVNKSELSLAFKAVKESSYIEDGLPSVETEAVLLHQQLSIRQRRIQAT